VTHRFGAIALERGGDEQELDPASTGKANRISRVCSFISELIRVVVVSNVAQIPELGADEMISQTTRGVLQSSMEERRMSSADGACSVPLPKLCRLLPSVFALWM